MAKYIIDVPDNTQWIQWIKLSEKDGHAYFDYKAPEDLTPYVRSESYIDGLKKGQNDAWEFAKIFMDDMGVDDLEVVNGDTIKRYFAMTYQEAKDRYGKWKAKKAKIRVGDEVETESGNKACVLYENPDGTQMFVFKADGTAAWWSKCAIHKTGKNHPEVAELLKKMGGEEK